MKSYKINGDWVELTEGPFASIPYRYGKVQFVEDGDRLKVKFDYETLEKLPYNAEFVEYIGPVLIDLIEDGVRENSITYTGGVDELPQTNKAKGLKKILKRIFENHP